MTLVDSSLSISEAAKRTGLSAHTLRYYEREGLMLSSVDRASSSHRRYTERDIAWVEFLTKLRSTGMPIARVRQYTELVRDGDGTVDARLQLLKAHRETVIAGLAEVTHNLTAIDRKIALYSEGSTTA